LVTFSYVTGFVARAVRPEISAGQVDSCAVVADGSARCWGRNDFGQLGNGTTTDSLAPLVVSGLANVAAIDAGSSHSCAVLGNGTVKCWGSNNFGQLGNGGTTDSHTPVLVTGLGNVVAVEASNGSHTCALLSNGTVKCWGHNSFGELGNGTTTNAPTSTPVSVSGLTGAVAISVGGEFSCAALANGTAKCWGLNSSGQLGNNSLVDSSTPVVVGGTTTPLANVVAVSAGNGAHACAALSNGTAKCWGRNDEGQLGNGTLVDSSTPLAVSGGLTGVVAISAGGIHSCAMLSNGTAKCWGRNAEGQLGSGNGNFTDSKVPVIVSGLTNAVAISAGGFHTCVLVANGVPKCWGYNGNGGLGNNGATGNSPIPVNVSGITGLNSGVPISAGDQDGCAVLGNGTARCWGRNNFGQLGNGTTTNAPTPVLVSGLTNVVATDAGSSHSCAMLGNGTVKCWGSNNFGQLGNGGTTDSHTPVLVGGATTPLTNVVSVAASNTSHTCALLSNGTVKCWGLNSSGQLGNGTTANSSTPVPVGPAGSPLTNVVSISAGSLQTCATLSNGTAKCWGDNTVGQLGNGTTANSSTPVPVGPAGSPLTNVVSISAGGTHSCATLSNGNAKCWGLNSSGQLGNGTTANSSTPVPVGPAGSPLANVVAISAGGTHSCAILSNGTVKCWGLNSSGQLGNGTANSSTPLLVGGNLTNAVAISAGSVQTCATLSNGNAKCWGSNANGGLGNGGTTGNSSTPVNVRLTY
jgi:alpha-tubulin suppressor-like RCC1 family protein